MDRKRFDLVQAKFSGAKRVVSDRGSVSCRLSYLLSVRSDRS